uniref:CRIB domain-containing protein n=1 Tax=Haemonchus contortus TaxID=6289 RepID=A0A7I4YB14_HAECO
TSVFLFHCFTRLEFHFQPSGREAIERLKELSTGSPEGDNEKKEHQKSFLGELFTMEKKKERKKLAISAPTQLQHLDHLSLEGLSKEDQKTLHLLVKAVDIEPGNEEQMQLLCSIVNSMRIKESYNERPSWTTTEPQALPIPSRSEAMTTSYSPVDRRKMSPELQPRNKAPRIPRPLAPPPPRPLPRLLSPAPTPPPSTDIKQRSADVSPVSNDRRSFFEEIPNVDKGTSRHVDPITKPIQSEDSPIGDYGLLLAIQAELGKRRGYIASDSDEVPRLPPSSEQAPRLPERSSSKQGVSNPVRRIEMPSLRPLAPPPPRPLPRLLSPAPIPPPSTDIKQRSADVSPVCNDRSSSSEEIPNVDKGRSRHVDPNMKPIRSEDSPIGDFDLLSAIQAELDKRRD